MQFAWAANCISATARRQRRRRLRGLPFGQLHEGESHRPGLTLVKHQFDGGQAVVVGRLGVGLRVPEGGVQREGDPVLLQRILILAETVQRRTQVVVGEGVVGVQAQRTGIGGRRAIDLSGLTMERADVEPEQRVEEIVSGSSVELSPNSSVAS